MVKIKILNLIIMISFCASILFGCASGVRPAVIPETASPQEEISKLEGDLSAAVLENIDVLAAKEFSQSKIYLKKAKDSLENDNSHSDSLSSLRIGRGYLNHANGLAKKRESKAKGLFESRTMALRAGAGQYSELKGDLADLDKDVSAVAPELSATSSEDLVKFQKLYVDLERRATISAQLGKAQAVLNGAEENDAEDIAPNSFKKATLSLKTAESIISTNVRNPLEYKVSVNDANWQANQLLLVMNTIKQSGQTLTESVAIKLVAQNKKISNLSTDLDIVTAKNEVDQSSININRKKLAKANNKLQSQRNLEHARSQFSDTEAETYQQDENLVIRLKQVNFEIGRSDLPSSSLVLLAKVSEIAKSLNATHITVEGHTDSVGTASTNNIISEKRANAVASYFKLNGLENLNIESEGFGFSKPIASNKSKEGRTQNRRVDIIITPEIAQ